jgi:hypothetical protein
MQNKKKFKFLIIFLRSSDIRGGHEVSWNGALTGGERTGIDVSAIANIHEVLLFIRKVPLIKKV